MLCNDCPRQCNIDRSSQVGFCGCPDKIVVSKIIENFKWEEPCISGNKGTLAIFFAGCNLKCCYCQNHKISFSCKGKQFSSEEFAKYLNSVDQSKYSAIEFISPTQFSSLILNALKNFEKKIPIVWNSGGYEKADMIKRLAKHVDVFMPDLKYVDSKLSKELSQAADYFQQASETLRMMRKCKEKEIFKDGILTSGLLIRHLVLPSFVKDSLKVLDFLASEIKDPFISLMSQFTPTPFSKIKRKLYPLEYKLVLEHAKKLGLEKGYFQDLDSASESFIPSF